MASSRVSSKSRPWASVPLARTACEAPTLTRVPITALSRGPPSASAVAITARPKSSREAASASPMMSSASSLARSTTGAGTRSSVRPRAKRAYCRAAAGGVTGAWRSLGSEDEHLRSSVDRDGEVLEEIAAEQTFGLLEVGVVSHDAQRAHLGVAHLQRGHLDHLGLTRSSHALDHRE